MTNLATRAKTTPNMCLWVGLSLTTYYLKIQFSNKTKETGKVLKSVLHSNGTKAYNKNFFLVGPIFCILKTSKQQILIYSKN